MQNTEENATAATPSILELSSSRQIAPSPVRAMLWSIAVLEIG
jgi:hypothetical protein